jgi:hypothetical protein
MWRMGIDPKDPSWQQGAGHYALQRNRYRLSAASAGAGRSPESLWSRSRSQSAEPGGQPQPAAAAGGGRWRGGGGGPDTRCASSPGGDYRKRQMMPRCNWLWEQSREQSFPTEPMKQPWPFSKWQFSTKISLVHPPAEAPVLGFTATLPSPLWI